MKKASATRKTPVKKVRLDGTAEPLARTMGMKALGAVLGPVTRPAMSRVPAAAMQLILDWADIVGPDLAKISSPRKLGGGTLTIACAGPAAVEIQFLTPQLLERVNAMIRGRGPARAEKTLRFSDHDIVVQRIRIVHDPILAQKASAKPAQKVEPVAMDVGDFDALNEVLGRLGGLVRKREAG